MIDRINSTESAAIRLCTWYEANHRHLPWRETRDPYRIWLSETMLQQTRVETVIPYYHAFLKAFPTLLDLAASSEDVVLKRWQGLGYYSRVKNLHRAAKVVAQDFGGQVPDDPTAFARLPGVGPYTCGAVQSIAFDRPVPAVDGNVLRVMSRFMLIEEPIDRPSVKRAITDKVGAWLQQSPPAQLTQALMELGATVCVPRTPKCGVCPLQSDCRGYEDGVAQHLPVRPQKRPRRRVKVYALWLQQGDTACIEQRPAEGLLGSMWQLPAVEAEAAVGAEVATPAPADAASATGTWPQAVAESRVVAANKDYGSSTVAESGGRVDSAQEALREQLLLGKMTALFGESFTGDILEVSSFAKVAEAKHVFTHLEWEVEVYRPVGGWWQHGLLASPSASFVPLHELQNYAWPRVYDKLVTSLTAGFLDV